MKSFAAHLKRVLLAAASLSSLLMFTGAHAAGTAANTDITNTATVNYSVGGIAQSAINSAPSTFKVDRKVNLTVAAGSTTSTSPGSTAVAVAFTVTNSGNDTDNFTLAAANQTGDNFDVTNVKIYRDNGDGVFNAASDTLVSGAVAFTADQTSTIFIVGDIPLAVANSNTSIVKLTATTGYTASSGADTAGVETVFADTGRDGTENINNSYVISSASLAVTKTAVVISDPINLTTNPKAIPGATVEYTITVTNSGSAAATSVVLTDSIPTNTTYTANSMTLNAGALTDAADADGGSTTGSPVTSLTVNAGSVAISATSTVKFRVTVK